MEKIAITALVPPEIIYACNKIPLDLNNFVPTSNLHPMNKLCAWCAIWRDSLLGGMVDVNKLVVVASGDCSNSLKEGERVEFSGIPTSYFFYPLDGDKSSLKIQIESLCSFLGGIEDKSLFRQACNVKNKALEIDDMRINDELTSSTCFKKLISCSDFGGNINSFEKNLCKTLEITEDVDYSSRVALIGIPPIYKDFHKTAEELGLHIVYDELPFEFARISGTTMDELAKNYSNYTFARKLSFRLGFLKRELKKRDIDGVIHYTQHTCHHNLEDGILRKEIEKPFLTIQGDMPSSTPEQIKLRLEAFSEMLKGERY